MLADPPLVALFALGMLALVLGGLWLRYRRWPLLAAAGVLLVLLLAWVAVGLLLETPQAQAIRRVNAMADALTANDWNKFAENVSDRFAADDMTKADLKKKFEQGAAYRVRAVAWDFDAVDATRPDQVVIQFEGKAALPTGEPLMLHFEATFAKDPDGQFRMRSFQPFDYVQKKKPVSLP